jgi:hypothetical protein
MARKKLLTEGEIRQFMKLANLQPIQKARLSEMGYAGARDEEMPEPPEEDPMMGDEMGDEMDMEMDIDAEEGPGDMVSMEDFMSALERAIEEVTGEEADVSEEPGDEDIDMDMEMGGEEDMMDDEEEPMMEVHYGFGSGGRREPKMKAPKRTGPAMGFGEPDPEEEEESEMLSATDPADDPPRPRRPRKAGRRSAPGVKMPAFGMEERVVNEVAKRVAARLRQNGRKEQMVDQLAERIMKRLTK